MEAVNEPIRLLEIEKELAGPQRDAALARHEGGEHPRAEDFTADRPSGRGGVEDEAERRRSNNEEAEKKGKRK